MRWIKVAIRDQGDVLINVNHIVMVEEGDGGITIVMLDRPPVRTSTYDFDGFMRCVLMEGEIR